MEKVACLNWIETKLETCTSVTSQLSGEVWLLRRGNTICKSEFYKRLHREQIRVLFPVADDGKMLETLKQRTQERAK